MEDESGTYFSGAVDYDEDDEFNTMDDDTFAWEAQNARMPENIRLAMEATGVYNEV